MRVHGVLPNGSAGVSNSRPWKGQAQAAILQPPESQVGAAMRAVTVEQAEAAGMVAEQEQVLAEGADGAGAGQFIQQGDGLPIMPQHPATGGGGTDACEALVGFGEDHVAMLVQACRSGIQENIDKYGIISYDSSLVRSIR